MRVTVEKIIDKKLGAAVKVIGYNGFLKLEDLPDEYTTARTSYDPYCYADENTNGIVIVIGEGETETITIGDIFGKEYWEKITKALYECAEKLREIREDEKRAVNFGWVGEETYEFCEKTIRRID